MNARITRPSALRRALALGVAGIAVLALSACGSSSSSESTAAASAPADAPASAATGEPLKISTSPIPHAEILRYIVDNNLAPGTSLEIVEITGDVDPNALLEAGDVDANYFQHVPYQNDWSKQNGVDDLVAVAATHVEPLGLYSKKVASADELADGATIALPNNVTNFARGLYLLEKGGLIKLDKPLTDPNNDLTQISEKNIVENPKNLTFEQVDPAQLTRTLDDGAVDAAVINGNYALEAGLVPATDAIVLETAEGNPYANILTVRKGSESDPRVVALVAALESPQVAAWIDATYQGSVLPVNPTK